MTDSNNNNNNNNNNNTSSSGSDSSSRARRSSFAGETFANIFGNARRGSMNRGSNGSDANVGPHANGQQTSSSAPAYEGPITSAARRLSVTTFGNLSTSPNNANGHARRESSLGGNSALNESAIDEDEPVSATDAANMQTAFSRRMSSSARALRDVRSGSTNGVPNGPSKCRLRFPRSPTYAAANPPSSSLGSPKEGFNWSENFRTRAERSSSIAAANGVPASLMTNGGGGSLGHGRQRSVATMEQQAVKSPAEVPKPKERPRPDHFQERILKGDFYMD